MQFIAKLVIYIALLWHNLPVETITKPSKFQKRKKDTTIYFNWSMTFWKIGDKGNVIGFLTFQVSQIYFQNWSRNN